MSFFDKFPYTNFHELNLDWIISQLATVKDSMLKAVESAKNAKVSETNAKASEDNAKISETNAKASEDKAKISETNAKASEDNAKISETNAKASEDKAKISETNAKASEDNAKISETNAKASEDNAKISETNAKASEDIAQEAETNAAASATKAENIASTLTNWSELDSRLETEIEERAKQDNIRYSMFSDIQNAYYAGACLDPLYRLCLYGNKFNTLVDSYSSGIVFCSQSNRPIDRNVPTSFLDVNKCMITLNDLTAGTHTKIFRLNEVKSRLLPKSLPYENTFICQVYGFFGGVANTPKVNNESIIYIKQSQQTASLQINSVSALAKVDDTNDNIQVMINYTVGDNYTSNYKENPNVIVVLIVEMFIPKV